jgi:hypothetical protein
MNKRHRVDDRRQKKKTDVVTGPVRRGTLFSTADGVDSFHALAVIREVFETWTVMATHKRPKER